MMNKTVTNVPKSNGHKPKLDRRVRRTRDALGDALLALMQERPFDEITVQHVLDRAGVGRSTFYTHYRDKDDLFLSDVEDFLENMSTRLLRTHEASKRVAPVREFFAHVSEMRSLQRALIAADKYRGFLELCEGYFARAIDQRLGELPISRTLPRATRTASAHAFSGAMLSLMSWWLDHGALASADQMDELFHRVVWSGVGTHRSLHRA